MHLHLAFLFLLLTTCVRAQRSWTEADAARYARNLSDSTRWDTSQLAEDLSFSFSQLEVAPPLVDLPSPVPAYEWAAASSRPTQLRIPGKHVQGTTFAYAYDDYRTAPQNDSLGYYETHFTIYILIDSAHLDAHQTVVLSRNYPHYLATGKQVTGVGEVSYLQLALASGENLAVVSRQYFDLRQGRTLLVAPLQDGSLRFLQLSDSPGSRRADEDGEAANAAMLSAFEAQLADRKEVINFFTQPGSL